MVEQTALLVIDLQIGMFQNDQIGSISEGDLLLQNARSLIDKAHAAHRPVFYVRHTGDKDSIVEGGSQGWPIHPMIEPSQNDCIIDKGAPDAFHGTDLYDKLKSAGITTLVVAGAQTEFCIDTTCRRAFSLGFNTVLISDGHSTWDSKSLTAQQIIRHHNRILAAHFVQLKSMAEFEFTQP
jgi:nicotinamidase-related amidase